MCAQADVNVVHDSNQNIELNTMGADCKAKSKEIEIKKISLRQHLKALYYEYCSNTSIHGIQYLGQSRPYKETLFWLFAIFISIVVSASLIKDVYMKWDETPVIVSFAEKTTPVWSIPFPAVTICSETKRILKTEGVPYAKLFGQLMASMNEHRPLEMENITAEEMEEFRTLLQICNTQIFEDHVPRLSAARIDYFQVLDKMLPDFNRYFFYCKWFRHYGECDELFMRAYTQEGICFTFNGLNATDLYREDTYQHHRMGYFNVSAKPHLLSQRPLTWSLQDGYLPGSDFRTYPERVLAAGTRAGFFIALQSFAHEVDYACRGPVQGFKVILHSPDDSPFVSQQFVRIPMGKEVSIAVKPNMITTAPGIASYPPMRRQCYLNNERYLRFFKVYSESNCATECLANFTLAKCGCVKFSMPRTLDTPVCEEDKIRCYENAEDRLLMQEFEQGSKNSALYHRGKTDCNCLPACTSLVYNAEISQGNFDLQETLNASGDTTHLKDYPGSQMSRLSIYFKENQFITSKRSELYGVTDFLANCGGIFGLFMGFSILSMVEMWYHITLRLWSNMHPQEENVS